MRIFELFAALAVLSVPAFAQDGYVVKAEDSVVYLDITKSTRAATAGARFLVYEDGEELVSPVTRETLGKARVSIAGGTITEVQPKFAAGTVSWKRATVKPGQFFSWLDAAPQLQPGAAAQSRVIWKSTPLSYAATALALGDFDGDGENELALSSENTIRIYKTENSALVEKYSAPLGGLYRILSLEASGLAGRGREQLFATVFDNFSGNFQTAVLEVKNGLRQTATLNWLVRAATLPDGGKRLYGQELYCSGELKKSEVRSIEFKNNSFTLSGDAIDFPRFDWVYGFAILSETGGKPGSLLLTSPEGRLRAQFPTRKNYVETAADYGKTPNVIRAATTKLAFYPRLPLRKDGDTTVFYTLSNIPKDGLLSEAFSSYKDARLRALRWTGRALEPAGETLLGAIAYDIDSGKLGGLAPGVITAVIGPDGNTMVELLEY
jgi:hypothetical protein